MKGALSLFFFFWWPLLLCNKIIICGDDFCLTHTHTHQNNSAQVMIQSWVGAHHCGGEREREKREREKETIAQIEISTCQRIPHNSAFFWKIRYFFFCYHGCLDQPLSYCGDQRETIFDFLLVEH